MDLAAFLDQVRRSPLRDHVQWFEQHARPAIAITRTRDDMRRGGSRFGGAPDLPVGAEWPMHGKGPYRFIAQIDLAELPALASNPLPQHGLLSLFVGDDPSGDDRDLFWGDPGYAVALLTEPGAALAPRPPPPEVDAGTATAIAFAPTLDIPHDRYQVAAWPFDDDASDAYDALRGALHGHDYLFGYPGPSTLAYDPTPSGHIPLLTVASDDDLAWGWHDGDQLLLFVDPAAVTRGRFLLGADAG